MMMIMGIRKDDIPLKRKIFLYNNNIICVETGLN